MTLKSHKATFWALSKNFGYYFKYMYPVEQLLRNIDFHIFKCQQPPRWKFNNEYE